MSKWVTAVWLEGEQELEGVLPEKWVKDNQVHWPTSNATRAMQDQADPTDKWKKFPLVKIKFMSENKDKCEAYDQTTTVESDDASEEELGLGKRKITKKSYEGWITGSPDKESDTSNMQEKAQLQTKEKSSKPRELPKAPPVKRLQQDNRQGKQARQVRSQSHSHSQSHQDRSRSNSSSRLSHHRQHSRSHSRSRSHRDRSRSNSSSRLSHHRQHSRSHSRSRSHRYRSRPNSSSRMSHHRRQHSSSRSNDQQSHSISRGRSPSANPSPSGNPSPSPSSIGHHHTPSWTRGTGRSRSRSPSVSYTSPTRPSTSTPSVKKAADTDRFPLSEARFQRKVLLLLIDLRDKVDKLGRRVDSLESDGELLEQLETSEQLENLNQALKDVSVRNDMIAKCTRIGGVTAKDMIRNVMKRLMTFPLMATLNMKGQRGKAAFGQTATCKVIIASIQRVHSASEAELVQHLGSYLKYAPKHKLSQ